MSFFIPEAQAQAAAQPAPGGDMFQIFFLIGLYKSKLFNIV